MSEAPQSLPPTANYDPFAVWIESLIAEVARQVGIEPSELVEGDRAQRIRVGRMALARALVGRLAKGPAAKIEAAIVHRRILEERIQKRILEREHLANSIFSAVSRAFSIHRSMMDAKVRSRPVVRARHAAVYLLLRAGFRLQEIAPMLSQSLATLRYSAQKAAELLADNSEPLFSKKLRSLEKRFFPQ